jgi:dCMP deaminase
MRVDLHNYLVNLAKVAATRATCKKRAVGAVIADANNKVIAVAYNGPPSGQPHCHEKPCVALTLSAPASHLACRSIHAEANALMLAGRHAEGGTLAITTSPCLECAKLIVNAGIKTVIFGETNRLFNGANTLYSQSPKDLLESAGILVKEIV